MRLDVTRVSQQYWKVIRSDVTAPKLKRCHYQQYAGEIDVEALTLMFTLEALYVNKFWTREFDAVVDGYR
jgi:hypothetical protein